MKHLWSRVLLITLISIATPTLKAEDFGKGGFLQPITVEQAEAEIKKALKEQIEIRAYVPDSTVTTATMESSNAQGAPRPVARPVLKARGASKTNVQVEGVDEADKVKNDGRYLYSLNSDTGTPSLRIHDTLFNNKEFNNKDLKQIAQLNLDQRLDYQGMYLVPALKQIVIIANGWENYFGNNNYSPSTHVLRVNITQPTKPVIAQHLILQGNTQTTRRINNRLYLVLNTYFNDLPSTYAAIPSKTPLTEQQKQVEKNKVMQKIDQWSLQRVLPQYKLKGATTSSSYVKQLYKANSATNTPQPPVHWYSLSSLITLNLALDQPNLDSQTYFGSANNFYFSNKAAYLAEDYLGSAVVSESLYPNYISTTLIHKFGFQGNNTNYRGTGMVNGTLGWNELSSFQMDEDITGNLRVVTYNSANQAKHASVDPVLASPVIVTALKENPSTKQLITLSRLPNKQQPKALGKVGERLYGARLINNYAYFVTFRNTDPLYVVDMTDPSRLALRGELTIQGFSDYLHPITDTLLLGVGKDADAQAGGQVKGFKLSLFDVSNPRQPKEVTNLILGESGSNSPANYNHHALTSLPLDNRLTRVALPITVVEKGQGITGLHKFEVDAARKQLKQVGAFIPAGEFHWGGWNDRSMMIGERLYYYHEGQFAETRWHTN